MSNLKPLLVSFENQFSKNENSIFYKDTLVKKGWNHKFIGEGEIWSGFITKLISYRDFLSQINSDQIIILSDSRDVICVRNPEEFLEAFESFGRDIVISMEIFCGCKSIDTVDFNSEFQNRIFRNCTDIRPFLIYNNYQNKIRPFINSGLISGRCSSLIQLLDWCIHWCEKNNINDDQIACGMFMNHFPELVACDFEADLLHTSTFGVSSGYYSKNQTEDSPTIAEILGHGAFFLHIPGIHSSIGQKHVYEFCKKITHLDMNQNNLTSLYNYKNPGWKKIIKFD